MQPINCGGSIDDLSSPLYFESIFFFGLMQEGVCGERNRET
jgi:hypothetical protein